MVLTRSRLCRSGAGRHLLCGDGCLRSCTRPADDDRLFLLDSLLGELAPHLLSSFKSVLRASSLHWQQRLGKGRSRQKPSTNSTTKHYRTRPAEVLHTFPKYPAGLLQVGRILAKNFSTCSRPAVEVGRCDTEPSSARQTVCRSPAHSPPFV